MAGRAEQVGDERLGAWLVRRALERRDRVGGLQVLAGERHGRDLGRDRLRGVEEARVELARLQPGDQGFLGENVALVVLDRRQRREVLGLGGVAQPLRDELALGVGRRIGEAELEPGLGDRLVPGLGLDVRGELALRVVPEDHVRRGVADVPGDPVAVARPHQRGGGLRARADEHVALVDLALDVGHEGGGASALTAHGVAARRLEGGAGLLRDQVNQRARVQHVHGAGPGGRGRGGRRGRRARAARRAGGGRGRAGRRAAASGGEPEESETDHGEPGTR